MEAIMIKRIMTFEDMANLVVDVSAIKEVAKHQTLSSI